MAFLDVAASGTLRPLRFVASALASAYAAAPVDPANGALLPALAVNLRIVVSSSDTPATDVQVQVDDTADFSSPIFSTTLTAVADGEVTVLVPGLVNNTTYRWRVRAAETGTTGWTAWSPTWTFKPWLDAGKAFQPVEQNIGPAARTTEPSWRYTEANIGPRFEDGRPAQQQVDANFGPFLASSPDASGYAHVGDVSTNTPTPHIWFLRPTSGREGDGIEVVGFGFGDLSTTYNGVLQYKPDPSVDEWEPLPFTVWQTYPETPEAYGPDRELNQEIGVIDMQHQIIEFTIPPAMDPPGHPVRVVTDGA